MPISEDIQRIILADGSALEIAKQAEGEGVRTCASPASTRSAGRDVARRSVSVHQRIERTQHSSNGRSSPEVHMATAAAAKDIKEFVFEWEGRDRNGKQVRGETRAAGENQVRRALRRQGVIAHQGQEAPHARRQDDQAQGHRRSSRASSRP